MNQKFLYLMFTVNFLKDELADTAGDSIQKLIFLIENQNVGNDLIFIAANCERLMNDLDIMQSNKLKSCEIFNKAYDLLWWLEGKAADPDGELTVTQCAAFEAARDKLQMYIIDGKQPGLEFLRLVRAFDPKQIALVDTDFNNFAKVMTDLKNCRDEWVAFVNLSKDASKMSEMDLLSFWSSVTRRIPKIAKVAKALLMIPANSAEVERSFSKYNKILSSDRRRFNPENLKMYTALFYNHSKIDD